MPDYLRVNDAGVENMRIAGQHTSQGEAERGARARGGAENNNSYLEGRT